MTIMNVEDLRDAFASVESFREMMNELLERLDINENSAVEDLTRVGEQFQSDEFVNSYLREELRNCLQYSLRKWRCESSLSGAYVRGSGIIQFLRSLTIFQTFEVPLFIDDYGTKRVMRDFERLEAINIDLQTSIVHVTHKSERNQIVRNQAINPSDNKNIIAGTWFAPKRHLGNPPHSVYGGWAFETTLEKLGVTCIRQGEIVSYKDEVNFILYAGEKDTEDEPAVSGLQKATVEAVKKCQRRLNAYTTVSIFVPSKFLPRPQSEGTTFEDVISGPFCVKHQPFCVRAKRGGSTCLELTD